MKDLLVSICYIGELSAPLLEADKQHPIGGFENFTLKSMRLN